MERDSVRLGEDGKITPSASQPREPDETTHAGTQFANRRREFIDDARSRKWDDTPAPLDPTLLVTIYGQKGSGKTYAAMGFDPDGCSGNTRTSKMAVVSMDGVSTRIHQFFYNADPNIVVFEGMRGYDPDPLRAVETGKNTFFYISHLLIDVIPKLGVQWVLLDGAELLQHVCEMEMRAESGLSLYEGTRNRNVWKIRNANMTLLIRAAMAAVTRDPGRYSGVVATMYAKQFDEDDVKDTTLIHKSPQWVEEIKRRTDIIIEVKQEYDGTNQRFKACVENSKFPMLMKTGHMCDVTDNVAGLFDESA